MKILVTGASGFIGTHVVNYLKKQGYSVLGCSRTKQERSNQDYIICNLMDGLPDIEVDIIVHTAALSPAISATFRDYFDSNSIITRNVLEYAKRCSAKRIIYMATVSSYGKVENVLRESSPHRDPEDYGLSKYVAEKLIIASGIPYHILVLPGVVGTGCNDNWIMRTAEALYYNNDIKYYNGKGLFNNILEIDDLCRFIEKLLNQKEFTSERYLLGAADRMTVEEVIEFLKQQLASKSAIHAMKGNEEGFYLDIRRALSAGFESKPLKEILSGVCKEICRRKEG